MMLIRKGLAVGVVLLFLVSAVTPMILADTNETTQKESFDAYLPRSHLRRYNPDEIPHNDIEVSTFPKGTSTPQITDKGNENGMQTVGGGLMDSAWPMFHHDTRHTGRSPYAPLDYQPAVKWKFRMDGGAISSPAIDKNGTIYIGADSFQKSFYAINKNGTERWHFASGGFIDASPAIGEDGVIYSGSMNGDLIAFFPNGSIKWRTHIGAGSTYSSPVIGDDGTIYVGSFNHYFYAINLNGTEQWRFGTGDSILSSAAIDNNGIIYFGSHDTYLYALYPNGTMKWRFKTGDSIKGSPSIGDDGTIYVCSWNHYLYAINQNGTLKWGFGTGDATETCPAIAQDGTIYIGSEDGKIYSIAPNGTINWAYQTGYPVLSSPAIDKNDVVYCGSNNGNLYALNPNGTLRWSFRAGNMEIFSSPALDKDGTLYIAGNFRITQGDYSYLYAFGRGTLQAEANGPYNGYATVPIQFTGDVYGGILPYTFHWDFGDGQTSDKQNPTHNYSRIGNFTVTFTVTDSEGNSSSDTALVTITYAPPSVTITKPVNGLYLKDTRIFPLRRCIVIGQITIEANADEVPLGIARVEFFLDGTLKATDTEAPYIWIWNTFSFSQHTITATAYDTSGKSAQASITVWKIF